MPENGTGLATDDRTQDPFPGSDHVGFLSTVARGPAAREVADAESGRVFPVRRAHRDDAIRVARVSDADASKAPYCRRGIRRGGFDSQITGRGDNDHTVGDEAAPFEEGRRLAGLIPGATFVALESPDHLLLERDPAWPKFVEAVETFTHSNWS